MTQPAIRKVHFNRKPLALLISTLLVTPAALAGPYGGVVTSGHVNIQQSGNTTNIYQGTPKAVINWTGFSIAPHEVVNFNQPSASAIALNRVIGNERSVIEGALNANGKVFLINSNGVLFTRGASVNTAGLVASTLNITDEDFNKGNYVFQGDSTNGAVINMGTIKAADGGYVALLGNTVSNQGVIVASIGTVSLNSGSQITLNFNGDSLVGVSIDKGVLNALVENKQAIYADGGKVILTAKAAEDILSAQVNNSGIIQARSIGELKGEIELYAHGGTAHIDGTLDASAPTSGDGGFIETSGDTVKIADSANITTWAQNGRTGTWLIDPTDFTIAASGGDMTGILLSSLLGSNNIEIQSANGSKGTQGDINVNDAISWGADTVLTLTAVNDININNAITATGTNAGLVLNYGGDYNIRTKASYSGTVLDANGRPVAKQDTSGGVYGSVTLSGANATLHMNGQAYTLIHSMDDFDKINQAGGAGYFALAQDIDASGTTYANAVVTNLSGTFAGLGHTIDHLTITTPTSVEGIGLIGTANYGSLIRDLGLTNVDINATQGRRVGALVGISQADLYQVYSTGAITTTTADMVGGLVGYIGIYPATGNTINISDSFSTVDIRAYSNAGGLVGRAEYVDIQNSHATGNISIDYGYGGGLVGYANNLNVHDSFATGNVASLNASTTYATELGGLVGYMANASLVQSFYNSFATGNITGATRLGGLIGRMNNGIADFFVENCYATGNVVSLLTGNITTDNPGIGGLIGSAASSATGTVTTIYIRNSYATGDVSFTGTYGNNAGGLIGNLQNTAVIDNTYATGNVTNTVGSGSGGLIGTASGFPRNATISNSYATGNVTGNRTVGGLVGTGNANISNSWSSGNVSGNYYVGGLIGTNNGSITGSYATGNVTNGTNAYDSFTGGLVGYNGGSIRDSYASGSVTGVDPDKTGALVGFNRDDAGATIENSYYNAEKNAALNGVGNTDSPEANNASGLTDEQMNDVQYYLDGTIDQVLAQREADRLAAEQERLTTEAERLAAEQAHVQAQLQSRVDNATKTGSQALHEGQMFAQYVPDLTVAQSTEARKPIPIEDYITQTVERQFSADVEQIEVDGEVYNLQEPR